jgi:hypothetical protein
MKKIIVINEIGKNCITASDGQKIYKLIFPLLHKEQMVELDFNGVEIIASPFFNAAIGYLIKDISNEKLNELLNISNLIPTGKEVLKKVIENSKRYYLNGENNIRKILDEALINLEEEEN